MVLVRLTGGLGNQMFQYAIARSYQRIKSESIVLDTRHTQKLEVDIEKIFQRPFSLSIFSNLKATVINTSLINILEERNLIAKIRNRIFYRDIATIEQELMEPVPFHHTNARHIYLAGNFQSETYFLGLRNELLYEFNFPQLDSENQAIQNTIKVTPDALSIHIRRGDYFNSFNSKAFTSVNMNYYQNAIDALLQQLGSVPLKAFVFTDDAAWTKENLKHDHLLMHFIEGNIGENSWKDMCLMASCQHHIIANSSFSWWGAWLSQRSGINMAPKHWYNPDTWQFDINNIVPTSWFIIDYNID